MLDFGDNDENNKKKTGAAEKRFSASEKRIINNGVVTITGCQLKSQ